MLVDPLGDYESMPDWSESADVLFGGGLTLNPSELHGALVGALGAGLRIDTDEQRDAGLRILEQAVGVDLQGDVADFTKRMMMATLSAVRDTDFAFQLLLPDDDDEMENRLASLGRWATGFLTGFTQAVSAAQATGDSVAPQTAEALKDFAAIAQVDSDVQEDEESEAEFTELVEYMRVASLNVVADAVNNE